MHWRNEIGDLRDRARAVVENVRTCAPLSARAAAACLSGVMGIVCSRHDVDVMQRACADLVRSDAVWSTRFGALPNDGGVVHPAVDMIAAVARGLLACASPDAVRAALSFWATESDPLEWQRVMGDAA